ncbi:MAG: ABC transporter permease [Deltaproteobacteria bacterium]|nr:ABC transporter permease [Deltaproteobacteria bacterium]
MTLDTLMNILVATIAAGTPLVYAALGELIVEKSGVLNLGVEGMMLVGAISGFIVMAKTGSLLLAVSCGMLAGAIMSLIFAVLTLTLMANQVASGLALTIFGTGLSSFMGIDYTSVALKGAREIHIPFFSDIPILGRLVFSYDILVYLSLVLLALVLWFLYKTRAGLILKAIGESPRSGHALGFPVIRIRYLAVLFGGAMAGLGGVYLSVAYTPMWVEGMVSGRGWVALALVVFATWRPMRVLTGAYLFGGVTIIQFHIQGFGFEIPSQVLSMLPYLATIAVLVLISRDKKLIRLNSPASLGITFHPENN